MNIEIRWREIGPSSERWHWKLCLYAYIHPNKDQFLYVGKADGSSVRARFNAKDKDALFKYFDRQLGITSVRVLVGGFFLDEGARLTRQMVADAESLLIKRLKPIGNISARNSRISRPGMIVHCLGNWPATRSRFKDVC